MAMKHLSRLIRSNLFLWTIGPGIVTVLLLGSYFAAREKDAFERRNRELTFSLAKYVSSYIQTAQGSLRQLSLFLPARDTAVTSKALQATLEAFPEFERVILLDSQRIIMASAPAGMVGAELPSISRLETMTASLAFSPFLSPESGKLVVQLTQPTRTGHTLVGELSLDAVQQALTRFLSMEEISVILCDIYGNLIVHPDRDAVEQQTNIGHTALFHRAKEAGTGHFWVRQSQSLQMGSVTPLQSGDWLLLLYKPAQKVFEPIIFPLGMLVCALLLFFGILAALLNREMRRLIVSPLDAFTRIIHRFAEGGREEFEVPEAAFVELGTMAAEFETMAAMVKNREAQLRLSEAKYRSIFENALEGIFQSTPDGRIVNANPAMASILGFENPQQVINGISDVSMDLYLDPSDRAILLEGLRAGKIVPDFEVRLRHQSGETIWTMLHARPIFDEEGELALVEGLLQDITPRKEAEEELAKMNRSLQVLVDERTEDLLAKTRELEEANEKLLAMDKLKSRFLASVSHELRTPLTSLLGFTKLINKDFSRFFQPLASDEKWLKKKGTRIRRNLEIIEVEGERLTRMINDFLDLTKIESGRLEWRDSEIDPGSSLVRAAQSVGGLFAEKNGVELVVDVPSDLPTLFADPDRIEQVVINLLNNAAKFTDQGSVILSACTTPEGFFQFKVSDTGEGIPAEEQDLIFDKFHQVCKEDTLQDKPQGTGLGLTICRQILLHYGGRIWVESELGKGSTFFAELPIYSSSGDALQGVAGSEVMVANAELGSEGALILVVDDEPAICSYLLQLLTNEGYRVATAQSGPAALAMARTLRPDCITMDIMMPGMDGNEAISRLRADSELASIPILVISVMQNSLRTEVDGRVYKPIDEKELLASLRSLLSQDRPLRPAIVLHRNGKDELMPYFALASGEIEYCNEAELWKRLENGFQGTVVLPAWASGVIDLSRLSSHDGVQLVILPEKGREESGFHV